MVRPRPCCPPILSQTVFFMALRRHAGARGRGTGALGPPCPPSLVHPISFIRRSAVPALPITSPRVRVHIHSNRSINFTPLRFYTKCL